MADLRKAQASAKTPASFISMDEALERFLYGYPKERLFLEKDSAVQQLLLDAVRDPSKKLSLLGYLGVWCDYQRQKNREQHVNIFQPETFVADLCEYFCIEESSYRNLTRQEMIQLSVEGFQHGLQDHVVFMDRWEKTVNLLGGNSARAASSETQNVTMCFGVLWPQPHANAPNTKKSLPLQIPEEISDEKSLRSKTEDPVLPDIHRSNTADGTISSIDSSPSFDRPKRARSEKKIYDPSDQTNSLASPSHVLMNEKSASRAKPHPLDKFRLNRAQRGTIQGAFPRKSLWKHTYGKKKQTYIVQVTKGNVSNMGKIEVKFCGYNSLHRVSTKDLEVPTDEDFDTYEEALLTVRKDKQKTTPSSSASPVPSNQSRLYRVWECNDDE